MIWTAFAVTYEIGDEDGKKAAALLCEELQLRGVSADLSSRQGLRFVKDPSLDKEQYRLETVDGLVSAFAAGLRGYIYAYSRFLRRTEYRNGIITLTGELDGTYAPAKSIRGHQLGYRPKNNTYDAWSPEQFVRYFRDMMMFHANTVELMPGGTDDGQRNELMMMSENEMLCAGAEGADALDMDVSVWYPNCDDLPQEEAADYRTKVLSGMKRLDAVFVPGGDPGDYPAREFLERACLTEQKLRAVHPKAEMWPSAQKPKHIPGWSKEFIDVMNELPEEITGIITGPNRAFDLEDLRKLLPAKYPIRFYPDITHNVRCEYPVHYMQDDWHYAFATTMGRESINPRPVEYAQLFAQVSRYVVGSVSYSEGCNDDINKMVWSSLDYEPDLPVREILKDYARAFFVGADPDRAADGILALEKNWHGDPAENVLIESTLALWETLARENPQLGRNWRFASCLFRAKGDALIRRRRMFELDLCAKARRAMKAGDVKKASEILDTPFDAAYLALRGELDDLAKLLFEENGMQLEVERFHASAPERGAVLDTIDLPITDRVYYQTKLREIAGLPAEQQADAAKEIIAHESCLPDEFIFSISEDTMQRFGGKPFYAYLNFRGDSASYNQGQLPTSLLGLYDHYNFSGRIGGFLPGQDYELKLILQDHRKRLSPKAKLSIRVNGNEVYSGNPYGGREDPEYDAKWLGGKYVSQTFRIPASAVVNGCMDLYISESTSGIEFAEMRILRA